jgi:hypothetical protein
MIALGYLPKEAKEVFDKADDDHGGWLDREEFKLLLKQGQGKGNTKRKCTVIQVSWNVCLAWLTLAHIWAIELSC